MNDMSTHLAMLAGPEPDGWLELRWKLPSGMGQEFFAPGDPQQPEQGWTCFGCGKGGTIIDFGAALYDVEPCGAGYHEIRRLLEVDLRRRAAA